MTVITVALLIGTPMVSAMDVEDTFEIKTNPGITTCKTTEAISCGEGKLRANFLLQVEEVEENSIKGVGKGEIQLITDGWDFEDEFMSQDISFEFDQNIKQLSIKGQIVSDIGNNHWNLNAVAESIEQKKNSKYVMDLKVILTGPNGVTIESEVKGFSKSLNFCT